ncbi:MAG: succinylglutamate desuccinylase/aspartoacylase family protein [Thiotrichales bacterium]|nr:succinylglutamate desuccinylase/aspartoacylase family protein [Thiotrichales bacterium]
MLSIYKVILIGVIYTAASLYAVAEDGKEPSLSANKTVNLDAAKVVGEAVVVAPAVDLKDIAPPPVVSPEPLAPKVKKDDSKKIQEPPTEATEDKKEKLPTPIALEEKLIILGSEVTPGTATRLAWSPNVGISGLNLPTPVLVINGKHRGQTLCLTAAIHGDELNGIEIVRRVMYDIDPKKLHGKIIGVPIVNLQGFQRASRYLPDRRDLNRFFPGDPEGSSASRIAHSLFTEVIQHCDLLIDLHTGSLRRTNLPQLRANMLDARVIKFSEGFDDIAVVHSEGNPGMLRVASLEAGIVAVTLEVGESLRLQESEVKAGVKSINALLEREDMYSRLFTWGDPEPVYYQSHWVRASHGGILLSRIELGDHVDKGDILGVITDPITNEVAKLRASHDGRIIGMAVNQVVMPGFAAYHIGIRASEETLVSEEKIEAAKANANKSKRSNSIQEIDPE